MLNKAEEHRYARQIRMDEIGREGQAQLKAARVLVVGAGGLGCPVLLYLSSMGVCQIGVIDNDVVDISNLHRQILFSDSDLEQPKVFAAKKKLESLYPDVELKAYFIKLNKSNVLDIFSGYDVIVEASDNFPTKYLSNDACVILGKPLVYGAANRFDGQVAVFNYKNGPTLRCLYPEPPHELEVPACSVTGVLGSVPGVIGTIQATETVKIITGAGKPLSNGVFSFHFLTNEHFLFPLERNSETSCITELKDYDRFCDEQINIKEITAAQLKKILNNVGKKLFLIDVRDPRDENIDKTIADAINIPAYQIPYRWEEIPQNSDVVVFCRYEAQSKKVIQYLAEKHNMNNLINLKDGMAGWEMIENV